MSAPAPSSSDSKSSSGPVNVPLWFVWSLYLDKIRNPHRYLPGVKAVALLSDSLKEEDQKLTEQDLLALSNNVAPTPACPTPAVVYDLPEASISPAAPQALVHRQMTVATPFGEFKPNELITVSENKAEQSKTVHFWYYEHPTESGQIFNTVTAVDANSCVVSWGVDKIMKATGEPGVSMPNKGSFFEPVVKHFAVETEKKYKQWQETHKQ